MAFGIFSKAKGGKGAKPRGGRGVLRALEAEAAGDYLEAARAYTAVGDYNKVGEMHLLASERAGTPDGKLECLREAARWSDADDLEGARKVRRRVAAAMLAWVKARGIVTEADRAGDTAGAATCHELIGSVAEAAEAYQSAGDVDQLERVLESEADRRRRAMAVSEAIEDHRLRLRAGDPAGALLALSIAIDSAEARDRTGLERTRDELLSRRLPEGRIELRAPSERVIVAAAPLIIGRELGSRLSLRDGGVSRHHAELVCEDGKWSVVDLGSKNGTLLHGVRVAGRLPLPTRGEIGIGDRCALRFEVNDGQLSMEVARGLDRGMRIVSGGAQPVTLFALSARFLDGRVRVRATAPGQPLRVNGVSVSTEVEPLVGDVLEIGAQRWDVAP